MIKPDRFSKKLLVFSDLAEIEAMNPIRSDYIYPAVRINRFGELMEGCVFKDFNGKCHFVLGRDPDFVLQALLYVFFNE